MDTSQLSAWFAGPKAENGDWLAATLSQIVQDYLYWRKNYFPEDGVVLDSHERRMNEPFQDAFQDRLLELLARLKGDFPFQSPRYVGHMLSDQTMPSVAGYFAAMLYNPNNVTTEAAPVTVQLELEAAGWIARMLGYGDDSWAHLTGGGSVANYEALWLARATKYLPLLMRDVRQALGLSVGAAPDPRATIDASPTEALQALADTWTDIAARGVESALPKYLKAYHDSPWNVGQRGLPNVLRGLESDPYILAPETMHYCLPKAADLLGVGRAQLLAVKVDGAFRMRVDDLDEKLDFVRKQRGHVLAVVCVAGSTEEGAVDPIHKIVALRNEREIAGKGSFWLHADAAYGGYLRTMVNPKPLDLGPDRVEVRVGGQTRSMPISLPDAEVLSALVSLAACDSVTVDPHKLGYTPYPAGAICFKSNLVKPVARQEAPYLDDFSTTPEEERAAARIGVYILEGSKPGASAAAVWMSHALIPLDSEGHGRLMLETVRNGCELHGLIENEQKLFDDTRVRAVTLCRPESNIVCYAFRPTRASNLGEINALNTKLHESFSVSDSSGKRVYDQRFFVSRTTLTADVYSCQTVRGFLDRLGVSEDEYRAEGVFLLRSVLMNPWYEQAKRHGRYFLSEYAQELYAEAEKALRSLAD